MNNRYCQFAAISLCEVTNYTVVVASPPFSASILFPEDGEGKCTGFISSFSFLLSLFPSSLPFSLLPALHPFPPSLPSLPSFLPLSPVFSSLPYLLC